MILFRHEITFGQICSAPSPPVAPQLKIDSLKRGLSLNELCHERLSSIPDTRSQKTSPLPETVLTQILDTVKKLDLLGGKIYSGNTSDSFIESQPFDFYPANK